MLLFGFGLSSVGILKRQSVFISSNASPTRRGLNSTQTVDGRDAQVSLVPRDLAPSTVFSVFSFPPPPLGLISFVNTFPAARLFNKAASGVRRSGYCAASGRGALRFIGDPVGHQSPPVLCRRGRRAGEKVFRPWSRIDDVKHHISGRRKQ